MIVVKKLMLADNILSLDGIVQQRTFCDESVIRADTVVPHRDGMVFAHNSVESMNDSAVENVILRFLVNHIQTEGVYGSKVLHRELIDFIRSEGINVGEVREDHFGVLLHQLKVCQKLSRKTINGERQTQYLFKPEQVIRVADNYKAKKN